MTITRRKLLKSLLTVGLVSVAAGNQTAPSFAITRRTKTLDTRGKSVARELRELARYFNSVGGGELRITGEHQPEFAGVLELDCDLTIDFGSSGRLSLPQGADYTVLRLVNGFEARQDVWSHRIAVINPNIDTSAGRYRIGVNSSTALSLSGWNVAYIENPRLTGGDDENGKSWSAAHSDCGITSSSCRSVLVNGGLIRLMADAAFYPNGGNVGEDFPLDSEFKVVGTRVERCNNIATCKRELRLAEFTRLHCLENNGGIRSDFIVRPTLTRPAREMWIRDCVFVRHRSSPIVFKGPVRGGVDGVDVIDVGRTMDGRVELGIPKAIDIQGASGLCIENVVARMQDWISSRGRVVQTSSLRLADEKFVAGQNHLTKIKCEGFYRGVDEDLDKEGGVEPSTYNGFSFDQIPPGGVSGALNENSRVTYAITGDSRCYTKIGPNAATAGCDEN